MKFLVYYVKDNSTKYCYAYIIAETLDDGYKKACKMFGEENIVIIQEEK